MIINEGSIWGELTTQPVGRTSIEVRGVIENHELMKRGSEIVRLNISGGFSYQTSSYQTSKERKQLKNALDAMTNGQNNSNQGGPVIVPPKP